jgi:hypothetical protein
VVPEKINAQKALELMLEDPLLIRRPLLEVESRREVGFDVERIDAWIGLKPVDESLRVVSESLTSQNLQGCAHGHSHDHHHEGGCKH